MIRSILGSLGLSAGGASLEAPWLPLAAPIPFDCLNVRLELVAAPDDALADPTSRRKLASWALDAMLRGVSGAASPPALVMYGGLHPTGSGVQLIVPGASGPLVGARLVRRDGAPVACWGDLERSQRFSPNCELREPLLRMVATLGAGHDPAWSSHGRAA